MERWEATAPAGSAGTPSGANITHQAGALVDEALAAGGVEGHLVALILHSAYATNVLGQASLSPWGDVVDRLLQPGSADRSLRNAQAVAVTGLRIALGGPANPDFPVAAKRELARAQQPPFHGIRDDERLLLGLAAGVGAAAPDLGRDVLEITEGRRHESPLKQACLDLWAQALVAGAPKLTTDTARRGCLILTSPEARRPRVMDEDRVAAFWLASRLMNAPWRPTDEDLTALERILENGQRAVRGILINEGLTSALDAALALDALSATPSTRFARQSSIEAILTVIDSFNASAAVLADRYAQRQPFTIEDEYDVQNLFRALTLPVVPDLQPEDPAPKVAGRSTRLDFTSRAAGLGIEVKHLKHKRHTEKVRAEVLLDERTYQEHPYVDTVVVFIHDPRSFIALADRPAFEADLSQIVSIGGRSVRYIARVR